MLVVGDREAASSTISVRQRDGQERPAQPIDAVASHLETEIRSRSAGPPTASPSGKRP
jgi:threonyl-tRNA synthetase